MSAGESAVLRSAKPHIGKENAMLPPLASPNRMLSISKGQKYVTQKAGIVRRQNSDEETKVTKGSSPTRAGTHAPNPQQQRRIQELEKSMLFMKEHHEKILAKLHDEIDELKQRNQKLNYRLVMSPVSLPAHLLSPEEDQPQGGAASPRYHGSPRRPTTPARHPSQQGVTVQLELMEGELAELRRSLEAERERSGQLAESLKKVQDQRRSSDSAMYRPPPGVVADLEQRLAAAENQARQLKKERDDAQRELTRLRSSVQFRPPWRAGGQPKAAAAAAAAAQQRSPPGRTTTAVSQQQLPKIPPAATRQAGQRPETRGSTAPPRPLESRTPSQGSLPALPRSRARQPPPPPPRPSKP